MYVVDMNSEYSIKACINALHLFVDRIHIVLRKTILVIL